MNRRLYRCRENRVIAGVASGVAEFLGLDPTLIRVLWFLSIFFGGVTLVLYIGLALIVPLEPIAGTAGATGTAHDASAPAEAEGHRHQPRGSGRWTTIFGVGLILLGSLALVGALLPDIQAWRYLGPAFVIGMGAILVVAAMRRDTVASAPPAQVPPQEPSNS